MNTEVNDIKSSFFLKLMYSTIAAGLLFTIIDNFVVPDAQSSFVTDLGLIFAALTALIIYKWSRKLTLPAFIYFNTIISIITYQAAGNDGLFNPYFPLALVCIGFLSPVLLQRYLLIAQYVLSLAGFAFMTIYHIRFLTDSARAVTADSPLSFGMVYFIIYTFVFLVSYYLNKHYELAKKLSNDLAFDLQEMNEEIAAQNEELRQGQEALYELNQHLENRIEERTAKIKLQNEKLIKYAFDNAHKVRGPLARILGLFYLRKLDKNELTDIEIFKKVQHESEQMDHITKQISIELESQVDLKENID